MDGPSTPLAHWHEIWSISTDHPLGSSSEQPVASLEPPPGVVAWRVFEVPPDAELETRAASQAMLSDEAVINSDGFHQTATVDYIYILQGELSLRLDDSEVGLHAGDCVVQRATNHAWHNYSHEPARVLGVMIGLGEDPTR